MRLLSALAALVAVMLVVVAPEASGAGGTPITACGQVVTTNAFLTQDMYCPGTSGVVVGADGITIDLKRFTLRGDLSSSHYGVDDSGGHDGVTVKNGVVRNFSLGVNGDGADKFSVSNVVASGNAFTGVAVLGVHATVQSTTADGNQAVGIFVRGASGSVKSSTASGNIIGIDVEGDGTSAQSSTADGNGSAGFDIGDNVKLQSVIASGNNGYGISAFGNSVSIKSSTVSGNGAEGIIVTGDAATIKGNQANGNGFSNSVSDLAGLGILVDGFTVPPVGVNTALGNDDPAECTPSYLC